MKVDVKTKTERYFECPNGCADGGRFIVEHLLDSTGSCYAKSGAPRTAGPWYCESAACGQGWMIEHEAGEILDVRAYGDKGFVHFGHDGKRRWVWVDLELPPQTEPVRFKVRGMSFSAEPDLDAKRYFYEEHTCPTNWFREVREIRIGEDDDPHGLFKLVGVRPYGGE